MRFVELYSIFLLFFQEFVGAALPGALAEYACYVFGEDYFLVDEQVCQLAVLGCVLAEERLRSEVLLVDKLLYFLVNLLGGLF